MIVTFQTAMMYQVPSYGVSMMETQGILYAQYFTGQRWQMPRLELKVTNPCKVNDNNILQQDDTTHIEVEDIVVGCIRSFDSKANQATRLQQLQSW